MTSLKPFCNRLARTVIGEDAAEAARLLRIAGLLGPSPVRTDSEIPSIPAVPPDIERVGIWERKKGEAHFVRRADLADDWSNWANLGRIGSKEEGRRRVVLLGESVARGYLYDPQYTPAMVLERILRSQPGGAAVEVIDLARTGLGLEIRDVALAAALLEPDAVVLFAGNNWTIPALPERADIPLLDTALREEGVPGLKRFAEAQLTERTIQLVGEISAFYAGRGVPLVWIVPEFNLGDWRDPATNAPHLPGEGANREWIACRQEAEAALARGDVPAAMERAQRMVELDRGLCVSGFYLLAEGSRKLGDLAAERKYLEAARDAVIWDSSRDISPRAYSLTHRTLREEAAKHGGAVVDLPEILREALDGEIPDRRMFLDYCHLTSEGIRIAMAAAAARVLQAFNGDEDGELLSWRDLMAQGPAPTRQVEAGAAFLAAVHNAHWWQSFDLVSSWCARAVRMEPGVSRVMMSFLDLQTRRAPMLMCKAAEQIVASGSPLIQHYLLRSNNQQLDALLLTAILDSLPGAGAGAGIEAGERLAQLRREEHSVALGERDLLSYYYSSSALQPQEAHWVALSRSEWAQADVSHFYKAYGLESKFLFVGEAGLPVRLRLTCRLPAGEGREGIIGIGFNGGLRTEAVIDRQWGAWDVEVPGEEVREGLNEVVIRWPLPEFPVARCLEAVADDLIDRAVPDFYRVFGEIHSFTASDGRALPGLSGPETAP